MPMCKKCGYSDAHCNCGGLDEWRKAREKTHPKPKVTVLVHCPLAPGFDEKFKCDCFTRHKDFKSRYCLWLYDTGENNLCGHQMICKKALEDYLKE